MNVFIYDLTLKKIYINVCYMHKIVCACSKSGSGARNLKQIVLKGSAWYNKEIILCGAIILSKNLFIWKHFEKRIILLCVRWYLKYPLSYRNLVEMMMERGVEVTHTTIMRWVHQYSPILEERLRKHMKPTNDSWRMDETYIKINGKDAYLYRAVDSQGNTIDFFVSERRTKKATKRFLKKALKAEHNQIPRVITTDKYNATEMAILEETYFGNLSWKTQQGLPKRSEGIECANT